MPAHQGRAEGPVTYLGVETSQVPDVVSEQLVWPRSRMVVEYVDPKPCRIGRDSANDILKW